MSLFGTDGIRGKANCHPLDAATLLRLGTVLGSLLIETKPQPKVLLAHDGRLSADHIRCSLEAGLLSAGVSTYDGGLLTTPALAHETRILGYQAGIMISASHNPSEDNGIKLFGADGRKTADEVEARIEQCMTAEFVSATGVEPGVARRFPDPGLEYREYLEQGPFSGLSLAGMRVLVDCANGAGSHLAPRVLSDLGASIVVHNDQPDGRNINHHCGALYPDYVGEQLAKQKCDLGLCLDGDGDRSIFIDETGNVVHGDAILCILAAWMKDRDELMNGKLAVTVMSNLGLKKCMREAGIGIVETPVGDRSVVAAMEVENLTLGGEPSGHIIFGPEHHYTGDGLYTCLKLLRVLKDTKKPLSELASSFQAFPQLLVNVRVKQKPDLSTLQNVVATQKKLEEALGDEGRIVLRYSGTENLCRVMIEGPTEESVRDMTSELAEVVRSEIGAE